MGTMCNQQCEGNYKETKQDDMSESVQEQKFS